MRVFCFPPHTRERNIPSSVWWVIPRGNGGEKEQRRETSVGKECSFALSLSRLFLSLSLFSRVEARAFLSSKVALSENLSQIHQNCGREGNETRLLLREKDFEREHAEPKKKQERERERERETEANSKNKEREEELFFLFSFASLSLSLCVFSLSLLLCFFRYSIFSIFFSLAMMRVFSARQKHSNAPFFSHDDACF